MKDIGLTPLDLSVLKEIAYLCYMDTERAVDVKTIEWSMGVGKWGSYRYGVLYGLVYDGLLKQTVLEHKGRAVKHFSLTAQAVDFLEQYRFNSPMVHRVTLSKPMFSDKAAQ